jgi:hypothetical protein
VLVGCRVLLLILSACRAPLLDHRRRPVPFAATAMGGIIHYVLDLETTMYITVTPIGKRSDELNKLVDLTFDTMLEVVQIQQYVSVFLDANLYSCTEREMTD